MILIITMISHNSFRGVRDNAGPSSRRQPVADDPESRPRTGHPVETATKTVGNGSSRP